MNKSDFKILIEEGNIGFYKSCEVTQLFISNKRDKSISNFFILVSFEEKPFIERGHYFLTEKKGIKIDKDCNLGIQRYWLTIEEVEKIFMNLDSNSTWIYNDDNSLKIGVLNALTKQFIPTTDGKRINKSLKNNFHSGSYILEFFDESKDYVDSFLHMSNIKKFNILCDEIKKYIDIDFSILRDRIGNIIFQFPINILNLDSRALSTWNGVELKFLWHKSIIDKPDCFIKIESILDDNLMGSTIVEYNKAKIQKVVIGNLDQSTQIQVCKKDPNLLLYSTSGSYIKEFCSSISIGSHEPRVFEVEGKQEEVLIHSKGMTSGVNNKIAYTNYIRNNLYNAEKQYLEQTLAFKQYFSGAHDEAINDIIALIKRNDKNGVFLWDPFLRYEDIVKTLFYSPTQNTPLKAIGSHNSSTKRIYEDKKGSDNIIDVRSVIKVDDDKFRNMNSNLLGLNFEFRLQHASYGWSFHDRFLIFPGSDDGILSKPKVYSLGTSINSLGKSHHILQEVSHPQRVIDAFNKLWEKLNNNDCIVWKYPSR